MIWSMTAWQKSLARLQPAQRVLLGAVLVVLIGAAVFALTRSDLGSQWRVLDSRLSPRATGEALVQLEAFDIPARIHPETGLLEVPARLVQHARVRLAAAGLPRPEIDEAPPQPHFGTSSRMEAAQLQDARERALAVSVAMLEAVTSARVHLALVRPSPFLRESTPSRAVVLVRTRHSRPLAATDRQTIQRLIAAAVPGLAADGVEVVVSAEAPPESESRPPAAAAPVAFEPEPPASRAGWRIAGVLVLGLAALGLLGLGVAAAVGRRRWQRGQAPATAAEPVDLAGRISALQHAVLADPARAAEVLKGWLRTEGGP